jgi:thiol:disulfide interchange protein/DsbC/DsbD-like thiol-disulfide interchange protein
VRFFNTLAVLFAALVMLASPPLRAELPLARAGMDRVRAELVVESAVAPGQTVLLAFKMTPAPGWHGYWQNPGDAGQGATFTWDLPGGWRTATPQYPTPEPYVLSGLMNHVYEHEYAILVPLTVPATAQVGATVPVRVLAEWLACSESLCVPQDAVLTAEVRVGQPGTRDPRFDAWRAALPAPLGSPASFALAGNAVRIGIPLPAAVALEEPHFFLGEDRVVDYAAPQQFARKGDLLIVTVARAKFEPLTPAALSGVLRLNRADDGVAVTAAPGTVPTDGTPLTPQAAPALPALPLLLLAALAGGLLLNVMPCVFPILSLKALSLARAGESESQARREGVAYSAGVILACLALGGLLLALRAAGQEVGWAFQLQEPLVVAALLLLAVAITANLLGLYEVAVPGFAGDGSPQGAFATGLLAAFAATPCTGPFMAAAMGAALLLPTLPALLLFAALGLGLALPFLALAWIPALRRRLPKPGAWMVAFRRWMALPMAVTALALAWLASRVGGSGFAFALMLLTIIVIAALVLLGRRQRAGLSGGTLWWTAFAAVLVLSALGLPRMVRDPAAAAEPGVLDAQPFSETALATARASGKPVFLYFTADWCVSCKVNERVAIEREATRAAFAKAGVIVLRGDWTRRDPAITRFLAQHGAAGVPLYLWYPPKTAAPLQLPQLLGPDALAELARTSPK